MPGSYRVIAKPKFGTRLVQAKRRLGAVMVHGSFQDLIQYDSSSMTLERCPQSGTNIIRPLAMSNLQSGRGKVAREH
jgi:hypothetical protein